ncbi:MAG: WD40 repeat domain-containing protein [Candidatus Cybelea sp.]
MTPVATTPAYTTEEHPFPGLRPFDFQDAAYFFGRERDVNSVYRLLEFSKFIAVIGSSGSGKSSLVRAGLVPLLEREKASGSGRNWRIATMHPSNAPACELAKALAELVGRKEAVPSLLERLEGSTFGLADIRSALPELGVDPIFLIVDQFEELFRYAAPGGIAQADRASQAIWKERAAHFVALLLEATRSRTANLYVLITMRSDFIGDCAQFADLPQAVSATQFLVPGFNRDQREAVICKPIAEAAKKIPTARIDPVLVDRLLNDAGDELDQLPVLQHCLARMWERSKPRHELTLDLYNDVGKISGALSNHADEVMDDKALAGKALAVEQVFRALSQVDREGRAIRRAIPLQQLVEETGVSKEDVFAVVERFRRGDCSFCVPSVATEPVLQPGTIVDVGHEALLRRWEKISRPPTDEALQQREPGWLWLERDDGRTYEALLTLARDPKATLPLDQVSKYDKWWHARPRTPAWAKRYGGEFDRVDRFLSQSKKKLKLSQQARVAAAILAVFALIGGAFWFASGRQRAQAAAAAESARQAEINQTRALEVAARQAEVARNRLLIRANKLATVRVAEATAALKVKNKELADKNETLRQEIKAAEDARNSEHVAETQADKEAKVAQREVLKDTRDSANLFLEAGTKALEGGDAAAAEVLFAARYKDDPRDSTALFLLDTARERVQTRERRLPLPSKDSIATIAYDSNPHNGMFATGSLSGVTNVWNSRGEHRARYRQGDAVTALAFDPSGMILATGGRDGSLNLHFVGTGRTLPTVGHSERVDAIAFAPDGHQFATSSMDGTVKTWSAETGALLHEFRLGSDAKGLPAIGFAVQFSPDGRDLLACTNLTLREWNLSNDQAVGFAEGGSNVGEAPGCRRVAVSSDGAHAVTDSPQAGGLVFYDLQRLRFTQNAELGGSVTALAFDPAGTRVLAGGDDGNATVIALDAQRPDYTFHRQGTNRATDGVTSAAFSADGSSVIMAQADGVISMYNLRTGAQVSVRAHDGIAYVAVAPAGDEFITAGDAAHVPEIVLWHLPRTARSQVFSAHAGPITAIAAQPRGNAFATGSRDGIIVYWRAGSTLERVTNLSLAHDGAWVDSLHFNDTGKWLAAAGGRHLRAWDTTTNAPRLKADITTSSDLLRFNSAWPGATGDLVFAQRARALADVTNPLSQYGAGVWSRDNGRIRMNAGWILDTTDVLPIGTNGVVAFSKVNGNVHFINLKTMKVTSTWTGIGEAAYCRSSKEVVLGGDWGGLSLFSSRDGLRQRYWTDHAPFLESGGHARVSALACSDDGKWLASAGGGDGTIRIWNVADVLKRPEPSPQTTLHLGYPAQIASARFTHDGRWVLTISSDGRTELWDRASSQLLETFALATAQPTASAFVSHDRAVVVGYDDGEIGFYPIPSRGDEKATILGVLRDVKGLQFGPQLVVRVREAFDTIGGKY